MTARRPRRPNQPRRKLARRVNLHRHCRPPRPPRQNNPPPAMPIPGTASHGLPAIVKANKKDHVKRPLTAPPPILNSRPVSGDARKFNAAIKPPYAIGYSADLGSP